MKEAGLHIWSQAEVRATKGEEWQGWLDALMEELDSIKTAESTRRSARTR